MDQAMTDEREIRQMVERWAVWRDAGDWERFATVWHPDGVMMATWFQGPFADFIRVTQEGWAKGVSILHFLGGSAVDIRGDRAIAQTKMTISQRGLVDGVLCDVVCTGASTTSSSGTKAAGNCCTVSRFTRRTGLIRSIRRRLSPWIRTGWRRCLKATGTSPTSSSASAMT